MRLKNKKPNITGLATTAALNAVENKIPNVSNLVMMQKYQTLRKNIVLLLIIISKFMGEILIAKIKEK